MRVWPGDSVSPFTTGFTLKVGGQDVVGSIIEPTAGVRFCSLSLKGEKWSKGDRPHQDASFSKECVSPPKSHCHWEGTCRTKLQVVR